MKHTPGHDGCPFRRLQLVSSAGNGATVPTRFAAGVVERRAETIRQHLSKKARRGYRKGTWLSKALVLAQKTSDEIDQLPRKRLAKRLAKRWKPMVEELVAVERARRDAIVRKVLASLADEAAYACAHWKTARERRRTGTVEERRDRSARAGTEAFARGAKEHKARFGDRFSKP